MVSEKLGFVCFAAKYFFYVERSCSLEKFVFICMCVRGKLAGRANHCVFSLIYFNLFERFLRGQWRATQLFLFSAFPSLFFGGREVGEGQICQGFNVSRLPSRGVAIITSVTRKGYIV